MEKFVDFLNNWLPAFSVIISAIISWIVASIKAKAELKKLKYEFEHQDKSELSHAFGELMSFSSNYCFGPCQDTLSKAIYANAKLLSLAPKELIPVVNEMHVALDNKSIEDIQRVRNKVASTLSELKQRS